MSDNDKKSPDDLSGEGHTDEMELRSLRLKLAFRESGLSLEQFSDRCSVEPDTANRWINGSRSIPVERERVVAKALGRQGHFLSTTHPDKQSVLTIKLTGTLLSLADQMTKKELHEWIMAGINIVSDGLSGTSDDDTK